MARAFEQVIRLNLERFGEEAARQKHIEISKAALARVLAGQTVQPTIEYIIDGHPAANEDAVRPFGVITYRFLRLRQACAFAQAQAEALSPVLTGRYRKSWFFLVKDQETALADIPEDADVVILTNDQPFSRKINVGAKGFERYVPPGICEKVRLLVRKQYGRTIDARVDYITHGRHLEHELTYPSVILTPKRFA
jgi:hypothetical protein